jgi:hypothetical protein
VRTYKRRAPQPVDAASAVSRVRELADAGHPDTLIAAAAGRPVPVISLLRGGFLAAISPATDVAVAAAHRRLAAR